MTVPFFRASIEDAEIEEVIHTLKSGWLTSGPKVAQFEREFAAATGAEYAVALSSCTAALHVAVNALGLGPGQGVLVPAMTFAATAEVVLYQGAVPILVDCCPKTLNLDLQDASEKIKRARDGDIPGGRVDVAGVIPVHVGGFMLDMSQVRRFADSEGLWVVEDAAHSFPAAWRYDENQEWVACGRCTNSEVACFSFYANKTITTGEGGMATTNRSDLAERMKLLSLHGLSRDAWGRYTGGGQWDYRIVAPGFKYNLTDIAASIGIHQLARAEAFRKSREYLAQRYIDEFSSLEEIELPCVSNDRIHSWHLFPIRLRSERIRCTRDAFVDDLRLEGVGFSVHWRPLHLHPLYQGYGWSEDDCPVATTEWQRCVSLPLFPGMTVEEQDRVVAVVRALCMKSSIC